MSGAVFSVRPVSRLCNVEHLPSSPSGVRVSSLGSRGDRKLRAGVVRSYKLIAVARGYFGKPEERKCPMFEAVTKQRSEQNCDRKHYYI